jgi:hypothetical protein
MSRAKKTGDFLIKCSLFCRANDRRSAASGEVDSHMTLTLPPLVGCSGLLASHLALRSSGAFLSGNIT